MTKSFDLVAAFCVLLMLAGSPSVDCAVSDIACTTSDTCGNGKCTNLVCVCSTGWLSLTSAAADTCNYAQRDKLTAFLLSFFLGWTGADWFYLAQGNGSKFHSGANRYLRLN